MLRLSQVAASKGLFFIVILRLLIAVASLARAQALGEASVIVVLGLSCSAACGLFPDQGLNQYPRKSYGYKKKRVWVPISLFEVEPPDNREYPFGMVHV